MSGKAAWAEAVLASQQAGLQEEAKLVKKALTRSRCPVFGSGTLTLYPRSFL